MKRLLWLWLTLVLLVPALAWATPASDAKETAQLVQRIYELAGPRVGCVFAEPSIVLTLGGRKASNGGWAHISQPNKSDLEILQKLNAELLESRGLQVQGHYDEKEQRLNFEIRSLAGLKKVLSETHLLKTPVPPTTDFSSWLDNDVQVRAQVAGPYSKEQAATIQREIYQGAPDVGIVDLMEWIEGGRKTPYASAGPTLKDYYDAPQPVSYVTKDHESNAAWQARLKDWNEFLQAFYDSVEYQKLAAEPGFMDARKDHIRSWDEWLVKYRNITQHASSPERARLRLPQSN